MTRARFSPRAERDLEEIWRFISQDNPEAAERVRVSVLDTADLLGANPGIGRLIRGAGGRHADIRWMVVPKFRNYLLFYRPFRESILVIRVLHAARDWTRFFSGTGTRQK